MQPAPSTSSPAEPTAWAAALGNRLRYLQANLAEETPENRQTYLEDELRRALQTIPASKRGVHLEALAERFPTWDLATVSVSAKGAVAQQTPEEVVKAFVQLVPQLSAEQRESVKQQLVALGLVQISNKPIEGDALVDVQAKLRMGPNDPIDPQRLGKLFATLADVMLTIDQLTWNVWKSAATKSAIRRDTSMGDLRTLLRRALSGDPEVGTPLVQQQVEKTRQLVAGLLAGLGPAGRNFARRHLAKYAPDAIREAVKAEGGGGGIFANAEARCWKKYTDAATELTEASIENDVQEAIVKYAEDVIKGSAR